MLSILNVLNYTSDRPAIRNKIFLQENLISFVQQGEKVIHYLNNTTTIIGTQFAMLSSGNCLMTEKLPVNNSYRSIMLFFDNKALLNFFVKYESLVNDASLRNHQRKTPFLVFERDAFIEHYVASLTLIHSKSDSFSAKIIELKFEELMLHLLEKYPGELLSFQAKSHEEYSDFEIRKAVELNITSNLKLEELAFLCHTSVSTFKRRFLKLYNQTPGRYFLLQKMEIAKSLLKQNENPSEVFFKVGYENHSSFSQSFKQVFGVSPSQFQQDNLTVSQQHLDK